MGKGKKNKKNRAPKLSDDQIDEYARLSTLHQQLWPRALAGDSEAATQVLEIMHQRAKLLGLYPPLRVEVSGTFTVTSEGVELDPETLLVVRDYVIESGIRQVHDV